MSERTEIQQPIIRRLVERGWLVLRVNGGRRGNVSFYHWWFKWGHSNTSGVSDILALIPTGRLVAIETKLPSEKRTVEQICFQNEVARRGGLVAVVDSADWQPPDNWN